MERTMVISSTTLDNTFGTFRPSCHSPTPLSALNRHDETAEAYWRAVASVVPPSVAVVV